MLTIDYQAFRAEFVKLKAMTSYQLTLYRAEKVKAAKWDSYKQSYEKAYGRPYAA